MSSDLESRFHWAMIGIYQQAKDEVHYTATRFLNMVIQHGGLEAARMLLNAHRVSEGYVALWERGRLDLTMEAMILQREWADLFTKQESAIARKRLADYGSPIVMSDS